MTLPPDPGSLKATTLKDQSEQLARAQALESDAKLKAGNITAAPGTDEHFAAKKAADDTLFYAGRLGQEAQGGQQRYEEERHGVEKYNEQVMHVDKDRDGRSDYTERKEAEAAAPLKALGAVGAGLVGLELTNEAMRMGAHPSAIFGQRMAAAAGEPAALADAKIGADVGPASALNKLATRDPILAGQDIGFPVRPAGMMNSIAPAPENRDPAQAMSINPQGRIQEEMAATLASAKAFAAPAETAEVAKPAQPVPRPRNRSFDLNLDLVPRPNRKFMDKMGGTEG